MRRRRIFVLVALVVAALTFFILDSDDPGDVSIEADDRTTGSPEEPVETATAESDAAEEPPEPAPGFDLYRNRAGYAFEYPESWNLDERGTAVEIVAPDASIAMSFGIAPDGDVRSAMGTLLDAIEDRYEVDDVRGPTEASLGTTDGVSVWGQGVNDDGVPIVFAAFIVEGEAGNYGVTVFSTKNADDADVRAIFDSFTMF